MTTAMISMYTRDEFYKNAYGAERIIVRTDDGRGLDIFQSVSVGFFHAKFLRNEQEIGIVLHLSFQQAYDTYKAFYQLNK